jgi:hypothetical protein
MKVESVLAPAKQAELADVATRLAKFNPTKIAIEALSDRADFGTKKFAEFTPEKLATNPDERVQIAYRLAHRLDQKIVYGIDEQSETIDYFPFDKVDAYAKAHGQAAALADLQANVEAGLVQVYGPGIITSFAERPALIGGMRIKVGSDVYDGSVQAGLAALKKSF